MTAAHDKLAKELTRKLEEWLGEAGNAKSTLAGALVVLSRMKQKCPLTDDDVFTAGGQLIGSRGNALHTLLSEQGVPRFLRDGVTTRSTNKFRRLLVALDYGHCLSRMRESERSGVIDRLMYLVKAKIDEKLARQHLTVTCDRRRSPLAWVEEILAVGRERSEGRVEQHLIGAKLEIRLPHAGIRRDAAYAGDAQTGRHGDFRTPQAIYHVTAAPSNTVIVRCKENVEEGLSPVLLVPRTALERAKGLAQAEGLEQQITLFAIEDFVAHNIVELAEDRAQAFIDTLREIIRIYNERIQSAETDKSLRIEIR